MENLVAQCNEAVMLWAEDNRSIEELEADFLAGCAESGLGQEWGRAFLNKFIPFVIKTREFSLTYRCDCFWRGGKAGRRLAKMKAAAMCGFFESLAAK